MTAWPLSDPVRSGTRKRFVGTTSVLLFAATLAAYFPALRGGFVWDDDGHVTRPELRSVHGLGRIWTHLGATQQYYPVLHSAFWVERRLWGDSALGYHLINVLLHATAACLFGLALSRLSGNRTWPWFAAFLFALHPVCVESVAWISEQKNTLSTVFYLLSGMTFLRWSAPTPARLASDNETLTRSAPGTIGVVECSGTRKRFVLYWLATSLFLLALLSKSVTATLPAALLVVLWWKNGRLSWKRDVLPLIPWFVLALAAGLVTAWVERTYIGARGAHFDLTFGQKVMLAGRIVWFYLGKLIWPSNLIFIYPRWAVRTWPLWRLLFPFGVVLLLAAAWLVRRRSRGPLAALLFFIGSLFPALGFFNVYPFVFSYVADHFQYLASMGFFAGISAALSATRPADHETLTRSAPGTIERSGTRKRFVRTSCAFQLGILLVLGVLTWRQCRTYRSMETLFQITVDRNPSSWLAQENLGVVLANEGRRVEAAAHYRAALRLNPDYAETHLNYGNVLAYQHLWPNAVDEYRQALRLRPDFAQVAPDWAQAEYGWASELGNGGHLPEAIGHYEQALRLHPGYGPAMAELGLAEVYSGRLGDAVPQLRQAAQLSPDSAQAHAYLGLALAQSGRPIEAVAEFRESLRLNPTDRDVHYQLALALKALGRTTEAAIEFEAAGRP